VWLPFRGSHQFLQGGSAGALQQLQDLCGLAALAGCELVGLFLALGRFLRRDGLLPRLTLGGRNVALRAPTRPFFMAFGPSTRAVCSAFAIIFSPIAVVTAVTT
jgi:hypothetical protein